MRALCVVACLLASISPVRAQFAPCEQAGRDAERQYSLPAGLLAAIGRVESGRWDATLGRTVPWPWAIDAAGEPRLAASKEAALQQTRALLDGGMRNIDVGCFQISLLNHPFAFADLDQAFDPVANANYAARFLTSLYARLGNWPDAVAAYHSATPALGTPYRQLVFANWAVPAGWQSPGPRVAKNVQPVTVFLIGGAEIRVYTPSRAGTAASLIAIGGTPGARLPRVITPGG